MTRELAEKVARIYKTAGVDKLVFTYPAARDGDRENFSVCHPADADYMRSLGGDHFSEVE